MVKFYLLFCLSLYPFYNIAQLKERAQTSTILNSNGKISEEKKTANRFNLRPLDNLEQYFLDSVIIDSENIKYGIKNKFGKTIIPNQFHYIKVIDAKSKEVLVSNGKKCMLYDSSFKIIFPMKYQNIRKNEGTNFYSVIPIDKGNSEMIVSKQDAPILKDQYYFEYIGYVGGENQVFEKYRVIYYKKDNRKNIGVFDAKKNEIKLPLIYDAILLTGGHIVTKKDNFYKIYDDNVKEVFNDSFTRVSISNDHYFLTKNDVSGLIARNKKVVFEFDYANINQTGYFFSGFIAQKLSSTFCLYDINGKTVFKQEYQNLKESRFGNFMAQLNSKWGLLDILEREILPFQYDTIIEAVDLFLLKDNDKYFAYNPSSNKLQPKPFNEIVKKSNSCINCEYCIVKIGEQYGIYDDNYEPKLSILFDEAKPLGVDLSSNIIKVKSKDKYGLYAAYSDGKISELLPCEYDEIIDNNYQFLIVKKNGLFGIMGEKNWIESCIYDSIKVDPSNPLKVFCTRNGVTKKIVIKED